MNYLVFFVTTNFTEMKVILFLNRYVWYIKKNVS
jgi:hypothetical protein